MYNQANKRPVMLSNFDKLWMAIERLTNRFINALHGEANRYAFRVLRNNEWVWETVSFDFANGLAGLGNENRDLL